MVNVIIVIVLILQMTSLTLRGCGLGLLVTAGAAPRAGLSEASLAVSTQEGLTWFKTQRYISLYKCHLFQMVFTGSEREKCWQAAVWQQVEETPPQVTHQPQSWSIHLRPAQWPLPGLRLRSQSRLPELSLLQATPRGSLAEEHGAHVRRPGTCWLMQETGWNSHGFEMSRSGIPVWQSVS